jgi:hypothetical protein
MGHIMIKYKTRIYLPERDLPISLGDSEWKIKSLRQYKRVGLVQVVEEDGKILKFLRIIVVNGSKVSNYLP